MQGGRVQLEQSDMCHAVNMAKMANGEFFCAVARKPFLPPPHSLAEDKATMGVRRYRDDRDALDDGSGLKSRGNGDGRMQRGVYIRNTLASIDLHPSSYHLISSYHTTNDTLHLSHLLISLAPFETLYGSLQLGIILPSHPLSTLLEPEPLFLTNSLWMAREVWGSVDNWHCVL